MLSISVVSFEYPTTVPFCIHSFMHSFIAVLLIPFHGPFFSANSFPSLSPWSCILKDFIYLKGGGRQEKDLPPARSFPKSLQQPGLGQAEVRSPRTQPGSSTWVAETQVLRSPATFQGYISKDLKLEAQPGLELRDSGMGCPKCFPPPQMAFVVILLCHFQRVLKDSLSSTNVSKKKKKTNKTV